MGQLRYRHIVLHRYRSGVCGIHLFQQPLEAMIDVIIEAARPFLVIAGVEFQIWDASGKANRNVAGLAHARRIAVRCADASGDTVVIAREDLPEFLAGVLHWNFHCWDAEHPPLPGQLTRQAEGLLRAKQNKLDYPLIHLLGGARLFVDSHDDTSLTIQGNGRSLARTVLVRALESLVMSVYEDFPSVRKADIEIAEVPVEVIDYFWASLPSFTIVADGVPAKPGRVRLRFGAVGDANHGVEPNGYLDYDTRTGRWRHRYQ